MLYLNNSNMYEKQVKEVMYTWADLFIYVHLSKKLLLITVLLFVL